MAIENQFGVEDGLPIPEVGRWAETKYRLIQLYDSLFATGMKDKWDERIYIDLYAGSGQSRVRGKSMILLGSPLLALSVKHPFDKYIFCEENPDLMAALKARVGRLNPNANVAYITGDCNDRIGDIIKEIPSASRNHTVLGLCLVDPFDLGIKFESIRHLSKSYLDFLFLLALYMDANRNYSHYVSEGSHKVDEFLGSASWREKWQQQQPSGIKFPRFLANEFSEQMKTLKYIPPPFYSMKEVRSDEKNLPLYHLALFSRSSRAYDFWNEVLEYSDDQQKLF